MTSLVEELQRDALDGTVDVSDLLRKAYVVATKLKLARFREWCHLELNGYGQSELPSYRILRGVVRAWNPYNGWIPFISEDPELGNMLSTHKEYGSVGAIDDLVRSSASDGRLIARFPPETQKYLMQGSRLHFECSLHMGRNQFVGLLDAVRNTILEWSLKLESENIIGSGMSFSTDERERAGKHATELQSVVNYINIGSMVNSSLQQASPDARQVRDRY